MTAVLVVAAFTAGMVAGTAGAWRVLTVRCAELRSYQNPVVAAEPVEAAVDHLTAERCLVEIYDEAEHHRLRADKWARYARAQRRLLETRHRNPMPTYGSHR